MVRSIGMLIVGITALVNGILRLGTPAQAIEKSGWLYEQFGDQGVAYGTIVLGVVALLIGAIMFRNSWWVVIQQRRNRA
ncbi:hypothetical protein [Brucella haematophila]|nr:hypothetical protein [Brucella haematophila]